MIIVTTLKMVGNATFIHLKMPYEPTKIAKEGDE
jgi:hypothetical protein